MSNNKVFYGVDKKKKVDKEDDIVVVSPYKSNGRSSKAFSFAFNDERKLYDLFVVTIDLETMESSVEVEKLRVDSEARAIMEVQKRNTEAVFKKLKRGT